MCIFNCLGCLTLFPFPHRWRELYFLSPLQLLSHSLFYVTTHGERIRNHRLPPPQKKKPAGSKICFVQYPSNPAKKKSRPDLDPEQQFELLESTIFQIHSLALWKWRKKKEEKGLRERKGEGEGELREIEFSRLHLDESQSRRRSLRIL